METWVGIDISKDTFDAAWVLEGKKNHLKLENCTNGFKRLLTEAPAGARFAMEATGEYHLNCARYLSSRGKSVSVLNPFAVKMHMQSDLRRCKSDKADAYSIAKFASEKTAEPWSCPSDDDIRLKHLDAVVDNLQKQIRQSKNVLHSISQVCLKDDLAVAVIKKTIRSLEELMKKAKAKQNDIIMTSRSEEVALACTIPGIGMETSMKFFTHVGDVARFSSSRSLISWIGLSPRNAQSGTSIHRNGSISRMGCVRLRGQLYMCAVVASRVNPDCSAFYHRLKELGKPSKVALIAVANKLLRQLYAVLTKKEAYVPNFCTKAS